GGAGAPGRTAAGGPRPRLDRDVTQNQLGGAWKPASQAVDPGVALEIAQILAKPAPDREAVRLPGAERNRDVQAIVAAGIRERSGPEQQPTVTRLAIHGRRRSSIRDRLVRDTPHAVF